MKVVQFLIGEGADVHASDDEALRWASRGGHLEVTQFLVGRGGKGALKFLGRTENKGGLLGLVVGPGGQ